MPIEYAIEQARRRVVAAAHGVLTDVDVFGYQGEVWARPEVAGFDELVDMSAVERIAVPSGARVRELAQLATAMDRQPHASRTAIVAPGNLAYGLGRMYQAYRNLVSGSLRAVGVFRSRDEAEAFLNGPREAP